MRTIQYVADRKFLLDFPVLIYEENEAVLTCVAINMRWAVLFGVNSSENELSKMLVAYWASSKLDSKDYLQRRTDCIL